MKKLTNKQKFLYFLELFDAALTKRGASKEDRTLKGYHCFNSFEYTIETRYGPLIIGCQVPSKLSSQKRLNKRSWSLFIWGRYINHQNLPGGVHYKINWFYPNIVELCGQGEIEQIIIDIEDRLDRLSA